MQSQFVVGSYNVPVTDTNGVTRSDNDALLVVGNGYQTTNGNNVTTTTRSNALVVRWNGTVDAGGAVNASGAINTGGVVNSTAATGYNRFKTAVLVPQSGDISMGEFTSGPQP